jgi:lipid A 3-O-deacylase
MKTTLRTLALIACAALTPVTVQAADSPAHVAFSVGSFDSSWFGSNRDRKQAPEFRLDYRFGTSLLSFTEPFMKVRPWLGIEANSDSAVWGGGGLLFDVPLGTSFYLAPAVGVGAYGRGDSKDLGSVLEFRSTLEVGYRFESDLRLGAYVSHMSNAGTASHNPGANSVGLTLALPVGNLF